MTLQEFLNVIETVLTALSIWNLSKIENKY